MDDDRDFWSCDSQRRSCVYSWSCSAAEWLPAGARVRWNSPLMSTPSWRPLGMWRALGMLRESQTCCSCRWPTRRYYSWMKRKIQPNLYGFIHSYLSNYSHFRFCDPHHLAMRTHHCSLFDVFVLEEHRSQQLQGDKSTRKCQHTRKESFPKNMTFECLTSAWYLVVRTKAGLCSL